MASVVVSALGDVVNSYRDNNNLPLVGGMLLTQSGGVNYPTYVEPTGTIVNTNPIVLNNRGEIATSSGTSIPLYLQENVAYTFTLFDALGNQIWATPAIQAGATVAGVLAALTQSGLGAILYPLSNQESLANITPTNFGYPVLNVMRYGAKGDGVTDDTVAITQGISVLAQYPQGELVFPADHTFLVSQLVMAGASNFHLRIDGTLLSSSTNHGWASFSNQTASQGMYCPLRIIGCADFTIHGTGSIVPTYTDCLWIQSCFDFDISLDCRGTGTNSNMHGIFIQYCYQFRIHDMTVDFITGQNMNNATEVYYSFLNNIYILSCYDFRVDHNVIRKAGGCGLQLISVAGGGLFTSCFEFEITNNTIEYNSESAIQVAFSSGVFPYRFKINENLLRYNQADGIDVNNTSSLVGIYAQFHHNVMIYNGWINCNPANPGGADGSGVGTFINVGHFEAIGNMVVEPNNAGIYVNGCTYFTIGANDILKSNAGTNQQGMSLITAQAGNIVNNTIICSASVQSASINVIPNCNITGNWFQGGGFSIISGGSGSKINNNTIIANATINTLCDLIDNTIAVSGVGALSIGGPGLKLIRNTITSAGTAITCASQNYCEFEGNNITTTGSVGMAITGTTGTILRNNTVTTATGGTAISVTSTNTQVEVSMNKCAAGSGGLSYSVDGTTTLCNKWGNVSISGTPTFSASTYGINY